jgi:peptidoglycan/xylan/chitin deacetylase (PgdA/CDA1 family)
VAIGANHHSGDGLKTRLYTQLVHKGRFVWMDFSPYESDHLPALNKKKFQHLVASVFRYLNKKPYQAVAMWPEGRRFAALFEHHVDVHLSAAVSVKQFFKRNDYPITWSVFSNQVQKNRRLIIDLATEGEIACRGDNEILFTLSSSQEQHERIARCQKVLFEITGKKALTFHPPEEKLIGSTLDAMTNNRMKYFIAERGENIDRFVPLIMQSTQGNKVLVSIPRLAMDSDELWGDLNADALLAQHLIAREVDYIENLGGLYLFSFSTRFMNKNNYFLSLKQLVNDVYYKKAYLQTATVIAKWWQLRAKIVAGKALSQQEIKQFRPVILKVDVMGKMSFHWYKTLVATKNE